MNLNVVIFTLLEIIILVVELFKKTMSLFSISLINKKEEYKAITI